jgi:hypothetical protein
VFIRNIFQSIALFLIRTTGFYTHGWTYNGRQQEQPTVALFLSADAFDAHLVRIKHLTYFSMAVSDPSPIEI